MQVARKQFVLMHVLREKLYAVLSAVGHVTFNICTHNALCYSRRLEHYFLVVHGFG